MVFKKSNFNRNARQPPTPRFYRPLPVVLRKHRQGKGNWSKSNLSLDVFVGNKMDRISDSMDADGTGERFWRKKYSYQNPKGKDRLPTKEFSEGYVKRRGCNLMRRVRKPRWTNEELEHESSMRCISPLKKDQDLKYTWQFCDCGPFWDGEFTWPWWPPRDEVWSDWITWDANFRI